MDAAAHSALNTFSSALVIIPPREQWDAVQSIRKVHDKAYDRWMPHINILYPFVPGETAGVEVAVQQALQTTQPFRITLSQVSCFSLKACVVHLKPICEDTNDDSPVLDVHQALLKSFPNCTGTVREGVFSPHLTLGQWDPRCAKVAEQELADQFTRTPLQFVCDRVAWITRRDDGPFDIRCWIKFGCAGIQHCRASAAVVAAEEQKRTWAIEQAKLSTLVRVDADDFPKPLRYVGGTDISFLKGTDIAVASIVVLSYPELEVVESRMYHCAMKVPYIAGFLAFREVEPLAHVLTQMRSDLGERFPQLLFVDGNGVLHPRGLGLASHLGVVCDVPTVGVAKNLLMMDGLSRDGVRDALAKRAAGDHLPLKGDSGRVYGFACVLPGQKRPIFISPGHRVSVATALELVMSVQKNRVPEPTRQADLMSRRYIRATFGQMCVEGDEAVPEDDFTGSTAADGSVEDPGADTGSVSPLCTDATVSTLGNLCLFTLPIVGIAVRPRVALHFVLDNSGSMGSLTTECCRIFCDGLLTMPSVDLVPGSLVAFSATAYTLRDAVCKPGDVADIKFPAQGQTNITAGVECSLEHILKCSVDPSVISIMVFLSDGGHNHGPTLSDGRIAELNEKLKAMKAQLSVIVVGIAQSDTTLGMKVKSGLESVSMNALKSVYYAASSTEMRSVLTELVQGCSASVNGGFSVNLWTNTGNFAETMGPRLSQFVLGGTTVMVPVVVPEGAESRVPKLTLNGDRVPATVVPFDPLAMKSVMSALMAPLSRLRVARGVEFIRSRVQMLDEHIRIAEGMVRAAQRKGPSVDEIGSGTMPSAKRMEILRAAKSAQNQFAAERNQLQMLLATLTDNSAEQASYLTGCQRKYAAKALARAAMTTVTPVDIVGELQSRVGAIRETVALDQAIVRHCSVQQDVSILSQLTALEQFAEWIQTIQTCDAAAFTDNHACIVAFSFPSHPIKIRHSNACQVDPLQTECLHIEPTMIDSGTLALALQLDKPLLGLNGVQLETAAIFVDPICPNTSRLLMRETIAYRMITSAMLTENLYMYHEDMTLSVHVHSLYRAVEQYVTTRSAAYLRLAVKILYSARRYYGRVPERFRTLFRRWFIDWETVTRSTDDACDHPLMLPLILGVADLDQCDCAVDLSTQVPLLTYLNEALSRKVKWMLKRTGDDVNTMDLAVKTLQRWLGINASNSPSVQPDVLSREPPMEDVRQACQAFVSPEDVDVKALSVIGVTHVSDFVTAFCEPHVWVYQFAVAVQQHLRGTGANWADLIARVEHSGGCPTELQDFLSNAGIAQGTVWDHIGVEARYAHRVAETMFVQAMLHHDSTSRKCIDEFDVRNGDTLRGMIVDLHMAVYFEACKVKNEQFLKIIGDVTYARALESDPVAYEALLGHHTHGCSKDIFWSLLRACDGCPDKAAAFKAKSNACTRLAFDKMLQKSKSL